MKRTLFPIIFVFVISAVLSSCGGGGGDAAKMQKTYNYERADSLSTDYLKKLGGVRVNIQQAAKTYASLKAKSFNFDNSLLTPSGKSFSTSKQQAVGLGMYSASMAYATVYEQQQNATEYMKSIIQLSEKLGIPEAFDKDLIEKLASTDTTINKSILLTKAYIKATDQLYSEERASLVTMMVAGGFTEGLLISTGALKAKKADKEITMGIYNQILSYEDAVKMLTVFKDNQSVKEVYDAFIELKPTIEMCTKTHGKMSGEDIAKLNAALTQLKGKLI